MRFLLFCLIVLSAANLEAQSPADAAFQKYLVVNEIDSVVYLRAYRTDTAADDSKEVGSKVFILGMVKEADRFFRVIVNPNGELFKIPKASDDWRLRVDAATAMSESSSGIATLRSLDYVQPILSTYYDLTVRFGQTYMSADFSSESGNLDGQTYSNNFIEKSSSVLASLR